MRDRIEVVGDLLMGAAYADQQLVGKEGETVRRLLCDVLQSQTLPDALEAQLQAFSGTDFDLAAAAKAFAGDTVAVKRRILQMVAAVHEADEELDLDEDAFLKRLAVALALAPDLYKDLVLEVEVEELRSGLAEIREG